MISGADLTPVDRAPAPITGEAATPEATPTMPGSFPEELPPTDAEKRRRWQALATRIEDGVQDSETRPVDRTGGAGVLCERAQWASFDQDDRPTSHNDLMKRVRGREAEWLSIQGLVEPTQQASIGRGAFMGGLTNQLGGQPMLMLNYILAPSVGLVGGAWANAGLGIGLSLLAPFVNAYLQPTMVEISEEIRERSGHSVVLDTSNVNALHSPSKLGADLMQYAGDFSETATGLHSIMRGLIPAPTADNAGRPQQLSDALGTAGEDEVEEIRTRLIAYREAQRATAATQRKIFTTQASQNIDWRNNLLQILPRGLRSPATTLGSLGPALGTFSSKASVGLQAGAYVVLLLMQIGLAAKDNEATHSDKNMMNMLYGDFLTASGLAKQAAGRSDFTEEDVDEDKLRSFTLSSEQAMLKRAASSLQYEASILQQQLDAESRNPDREAAAAEQADLRARLDSMKQEIEILKSGRVTELSQGGPAALLLEAYDTGFASSYLRKGIKAKHNKPGEFSAQLGQRIAQTGHLLFAGSGAAALIGKVGIAAVGGARNASPGLVCGLASIGTVMGLVGACYQGSITTVKNHRRDGLKVPEAKDDQKDIGLPRQLLEGLLAAPITYMGARAMSGATGALDAKLNEMQEAAQWATLLENALEMLEPTARAASSGAAAT